MAETFDNLTNHVSIYTDTFSFTSLDFSYFCYAQVQIAMVGKYIGLTDSYLSVVKALLHACIACSLKPHIEWIAASDLEDESEKSTPEAHAAAWKILKVRISVLEFSDLI
jgi:CTP synthase